MFHDMNIGNPDYTIYEGDKKYMFKNILKNYDLPEGIKDEYERTGIDEPVPSHKLMDFGGEELPDSGARRTFLTGSVRDIRDGKGRYDLISPIALKSLAKRLEDGMSKYGERNWERGQNLMAYLDSAIRHINTYITDIMTGEVHAEDHIGAAFWNLHSFIHTKHMIEIGLLPRDLDDLPLPERVLGETPNETPCNCTSCKCKP